MKKLVAYITTGYPDVNFTVDLALSLKQNGVDILELGVPFSDPVADGNIIAKANSLSLQNGFTCNDLFEASKTIAGHIDTLWMGYFNTFYNKGMDFMLGKAKSYGVSGFIIPDLPYEESLGHKALLEGAGVELISFIAPTHSNERIKMITQNANKFIYLVAYAGITGNAKEENLQGIIEEIRKNTQTPIFLGFGVDEKNAKEKSKDVDGVIVGSAFVKVLLDEDLTKSQKIDKISSLAKQIKEAIN